MAYTYVELSPTTTSAMRGTGTFSTLEDATQAAKYRAAHTHDWLGIEVWRGSPRNLIECVAVIRPMGKM